MKRLKKRMTALLLSFLLSFSCIACSYENVKATGLEVPVALQILESILLSFGIPVVTGDMINNAVNDSWWDGTGALQPVQDMYDQLEEEYTKERFKVINGSGGSDPDPTPTPAITGEPEPAPTPVEEIPTFQEITEEVSSKGFIELTAGALGVMASAVSNLWDRIMGRVDVDEGVPEQCVNLITGSGYPYYNYYRSGTTYLFYMFGPGAFIDDSQDRVRYTSSVSYKKGKYDSSFSLSSAPVSVVDGSCGTGRSGSYVHIASNLPIFSSAEEGFQWRDSIVSLPSKEEIWVHPDLQDTYQNNGKLEYPQQAPQPLTIPSIQQLQDLAKKLNPEINPEYSPEIAPNYIKELIEQLQREPSVDPDPGTDPNPNPDPNPDPDPDVTPDPDEPGVDDGDPVKDYKTDLRQIFPFCIPFDLVNLLDALDAEPVAPKFEIPIDIEVNNPFTKSKILDYHNVIVIDLSVYEDAVKVVRIFEILFFILGLLLITRQQMIKG
ncbi:MAG: hypothetical protein ACI4C4_11835 [Lachnospiraceae bacterium]